MFFITKLGKIMAKMPYIIAAFWAILLGGQGCVVKLHWARCSLFSLVKVIA